MNGYYVAMLNKILNFELGIKIKQRESFIASMGVEWKVHALRRHHVEEVREIFFFDFKVTLGF